jgi:hypothetical protein
MFQLGEDLADVIQGLATAQGAMGHDAQEAVGQVPLAGGRVDPLGMAEEGGVEIAGNRCCNWHP